MEDNDDEGSRLVSKQGQSAIEYILTYGWMLLVIAIVGGAIFATVEGGYSGEKIDTELVDEFITSQGGYESCDVEPQVNESRAVADCTRTISDYNNTTFLDGQRFYVETAENGSIAIYDHKEQH